MADRTRVLRVTVVVGLLVWSARLPVELAAQSAVSEASKPVAPPSPLLDAQLGVGPQVEGRAAVAAARGAAPAGRQALPPSRSFALMSPAERRAVIDAHWGEGPSTDEKLAMFDTFWNYVDAKFAGFQNLDVDWAAMRARYRPEVAKGVTRGRFAAIINHMSLSLRDSHTIPLDLPVNVFSAPVRGVPLLGVGSWLFDTSGACVTAQEDGSALVYAALLNHPLGLERGDRILGYEGRPWAELYKELLADELPLWPLWWGTSPSSFDHAFVMAAGLNWHLFDTMDILKYRTGQVVHMPTSLMPGPLFMEVCSEQVRVPGVPQPGYFGHDYVRAGIVSGTRIGYVYVWGWLGSAVDDFAAAIDRLTRVERVEGLILDLRFNEGGFLNAPFRSLGLLAPRSTPTFGMFQRKRPGDHLKMRSIAEPGEFRLDDVDDVDDGDREREPFEGPIAVLVGPGSLSAGDFSAVWSTYLPRVRTFGKSTAMATGLPTQPALGTSLDLGPDWFATVAETNTSLVGARDFLIHTEFPVDEPVWLTPDDVAAGRDTVAFAALVWLGQQIP
jgi:hypothetical protein